MVYFVFLKYLDPFAYYFIAFHYFLSVINFLINLFIFTIYYFLNQNFFIYGILFINPFKFNKYNILIDYLSF